MASASILNTGKAMYAWNGTNWLPLNAQNNLINSTRWQKIATGGETTLSGYDDNGLNLSYSPGYEQVFLNGILLVRNSDYTASNGTSITGLASIGAGSVIEIISLKSLSIANVYTQEQSDSLYATQNDLDNIDLSLYLTQSNASATYLTQSSASTQYEKLIPYSSSAPSSPTEGDLWVDSTVPTIKAYIGGVWTSVGGGAADSDQAVLSGRIFS